MHTEGEKFNWRCFSDWLQVESPDFLTEGMIMRGVYQTEDIIIGPFTVTKVEICKVGYGIQSHAHHWQINTLTDVYYPPTYIQGSSISS